jgi:molecular chaperone GrpE
MSPETEAGAGAGTPDQASASEPAENGTDTTGPVDGEGESTDADAAEPIELDIESLLSERDQFKDIALRLQADFENYRRRMNAQKSEEIDRATGRVVEGLLPVLDACEAAFAHGADQVEPVWSALIGALQKQGLEALDLQDKPFDPSVAEAVAHEPGADEVFDGPVVVETLRTGYRWKGKVLRPAMVRTRG